MKKANAETPGELQIEHQLAGMLKSEPSLWTPDCLEPEQIIALVEKTVPETEAVPYMAHVALCPRCRQEYAETVELFQLAEEVGHLKAQAEQTPAAAAATVTPTQENPIPASAKRERPRDPFWQNWRKWLAPGFGFTLGAAATGVLLFLLWNVPAGEQRAKLVSVQQERDTQKTQSERMEQENKTLGQELAALKQRQADSLRLEQEVARLNAQVKSQLTQAKSQQAQVARLTEAEKILQQMPLPAPDWMRARYSAAVRGNGGTDAATPQLVLVHPINVAIVMGQPILECRPVPDAKSYQVSLEREGSNEEIPVPKSLSATRWQVTAPLLPGQVYKWAVTAQRGSESLRSPLATFYVLSAAEQRDLKTARQKYAHNPLTLGAVYARLGMTAEAEQQFRAVLQSNANDPIAKRWLKELEARKH